MDFKEKPLFSTDAKVDTSKKSKKDEKLDHYIKSDGPLKMRLEKNGRGGKAVTVLFQLPFDEEKILSLMKEMQKKFGVGATFKNGQVELRGDVRDKAEGFLREKNIKVIRAGG